MSTRTIKPRDVDLFIVGEYNGTPEYFDTLAQSTKTCVQIAREWNARGRELAVIGGRERFIARVRKVQS